MNPAPAIVFIDPGPNLAQYFAAVGAGLAPAYRAVFFAPRVKSRSILRRLHGECYPARREWRTPSHAAALPHLDRAALVAQLRQPSDRALVAGDDPVFQHLARDLAALFVDLQPAGVVCWNGSGLAAAIATQLARAQNVPVLFAENGYLPNTLQLDALGVNARSSLTQRLAEHADAIATRPISPAHQHELDTVLTAYRAGQPPPQCPPAGGWVRASPLAYLIQAGRDWRARSPSARLNRRIPRQIPALPERFVFFPLQVRQDSQLQLHSPLYGARLDLAIRDLAQAVQALDPPRRLVVKLHPADLNKTDYDPIAAELPAVVWIGGGDVRTLVQRAEAVVTINSTVGIEALIFGKPVVTLGDNLYVHERLVHPVRQREALLTQLQHALNTPPDSEFIARYLHFLYFEGLVRAHWRDFSPSSVQQFADAISDRLASAASP